MTTTAAPRPPLVEIDGLPRLMPFKYTKTEDQVFTHRPYFTRPSTVFEYPLNDPAANNEVFEYIGDSVLSLAVGLLTKKIYPRLRVGPHAKIRSLVMHNVTIASISEHYGLSKRLRTKQSQLVSLQRSVFVQVDLFEAYIGGLYDDWGWEYVMPWLYKVLLPYIEGAYRIVQGLYYQSRDHNSPNPGGGIGPQSPPICPSDGPNSEPNPQNNVGIFPLSRLGGPSPSFSDGRTPLAPTTSLGGALAPSLIFDE